VIEHQFELLSTVLVYADKTAVAERIRTAQVAGNDPDSRAGHPTAQAADTTLPPDGRRAAAGGLRRSGDQGTLASARRHTTQGR
jgi:hypothetical protein